MAEKPFWEQVSPDDLGFLPGAAASVPPRDQTDATSVESDPMAVLPPPTPETRFTSPEDAPPPVAPGGIFVPPADMPPPVVSPPSAYEALDSHPVALGSLDSIFGDDPSAPVSPSTKTPATEPLGTSPTVSNAPESTDVANDDVIVDDSPSAAVDTSEATSGDHAARRRARRQGSLDAMRAASIVMTPEETELASARDQFERRMQNLENFYVYVDNILDFVATDMELQQVIISMELTNDPVKDLVQRNYFEKEVRPRLTEANIQISTPRDIQTIFDLAYDEIIGISVVGDLWRDLTVDEICIDAWNKIVVERYGRLQDTGYRFRSPEHAAKVARQLSQMVSDRSVSNANPLPTAILPATRIQFAWGDLVAGGLAITIRKFKSLMDMDGLLSHGSLNEEMRDFLVDAVRARATLLVAGGVGTGKTTMINALSGFIPDSERVITIEDAWELQLTNHHIVSLQAKMRSRMDEAVVVTQEDLLIASLRMRPDRIVVGEVREPMAAATMIQAANTGHDGTMTTIHASSPSAALNSRMTSLLTRSSSGFSESVARLEVATAFDLVIQITRTAGQRYISEIALVDPSRVTNRIDPLTIFTGHLNENKDAVIYNRVAPMPDDFALTMKMADAGIDTSRWTTPPQ